MKGASDKLKRFPPSLLLLLVLLLFAACSTSRPITTESAHATIVQNETTKKHIKEFSDTNKKIQAHVQKVQEQSKKVQEQAVKESDALDEVIKGLKTLLGNRQ